MDILEFYRAVLRDEGLRPEVRALLAREYSPLKATPLLQVFLSHSAAVVAASVDLAQKCGADLKFVKEAAWLHDVGIKYTRAPGIHCHGRVHYLEHGIVGSRLCREFGLLRHSLVCERHVGTGLTAEEITEQSLPLPVRDMLNRSLEERLICYVDQFFSKSTPGRLSLEVVRQKIARHGSTSLARFEEFHAEFGSLFWGPEAASKSSGMESFLTELGANGSAEESHFTLNPLAALRKMSRFQLPNPSLWAVKLVQAAVALGAERVEFRFGRQETECLVYGPQLPQAREIYDELLSGNNATSRGRQHLLVGLRALAGQDLPLWGWSSVSQGTRQEVQFSPTGVEQAQDTSDDGLSAFRVWAQKSRGALERAEEHKLLSDHCLLTPLPVRVDGRQVGPGHPADLVTGDFAALWMDGPEIPGVEFQMVPLPDRERRRKPFLIATKSLSKAPGFQPCGMLIVAAAPSLFSAGGQTSELFWLRDGVLLGPRRLNFQSKDLIVKLVCPGDHLETDLSEWNVRDDQKLCSENQALRNLREMVEKLWPRRRRMRKLQSPAELKWLKRLGMLGQFIGEVAELFAKQREELGLPPEFLDELSRFNSESLRIQEP